MSQQEIIQLLDRYLAGTATIPEQERVEAWLDSNEDLNNDWEQMDETQRNDFLATLYQRIQVSIQQRDKPVVSMGSRRWVKWIAAAAIIVMIVGGWWMMERKAQVTGGKSQVARTNDVAAPTNTRAVITLADGSKVYLDSLGNGVIAQQNNVKVVKNNSGEIVYQSLTTGHSPLTYNTLFNPRGSKVISLTLSDGTKVWLNSESSLKYPTAFAASTREVEITGEAYFEVQHNAKQPFKVHLPNGSVIEDIGTAFNVNAYSDEDAIKATLIEGSVKITAANARVKLEPRQQAVLTGHSLLTTHNDVDVNQVVAWKNGIFSFKSTDLKTMMRQIARWYDVDINYDGNIPERTFTGEIPRTVNLSELLKLFEASKIHFYIDAANKKLTIHS